MVRQPRVLKGIVDIEIRYYGEDEVSISFVAPQGAYTFYTTTPPGRNIEESIKSLKNYFKKITLEWPEQSQGNPRGNKEYPLYDYYGQCPTARYVGGTSKYLCECPQPTSCPGVIAVQRAQQSQGNPQKTTVHGIWYEVRYWEHGDKYPKYDKVLAAYKSDLDNEMKRLHPNVSYWTVVRSKPVLGY